jgi:hypothetical protein
MTREIIRCGDYRMILPTNKWQWTRYLLQTVAAEHGDGNRTWVGLYGR